MSKEDDRVPAELLVPTLGAVIFASAEPVPLGELAEALGGLDKAELEAALEELARSYEKSDAGLRLERVAGGYRLATRVDTGAWVRRFFQHRNRTRLTPAALETLAIVAYRQPVTAPEIQSIRGKDPSAALKSLLDKRMIRILGKKKVVGSPLLYGTRREFLVHFGLDALSDLPSIDEFDEFIGALEGDQASLLTPPTEEPEYEPLDEGAAEGDAAIAGAADALSAGEGELDGWADDGRSH